MKHKIKLPKEETRQKIKFDFFIIFILALGVIFFLYQNYKYDIKDLLNYIQGYGMFMPVMLFFLVIVTSFIGVIFQIPVAVAALKLNFFWAFIVSWLGLTVGSVLTFYFARYFGRSYFEKKFSKSEKFKHYDSWFRSHGFWAIILFRLITLIPFEIVNIFAGLSRVKFKDFFWGSFFGLVPGILISVYFISTLKTIWSWHFFVASLLMTIFSLTPLAFRKIRKLIFAVSEKDDKK